MEKLVADLRVSLDCAQHERRLQALAAEEASTAKEHGIQAAEDAAGSLASHARASGCEAKAQAAAAEASASSLRTENATLEEQLRQMMRDTGTAVERVSLAESTAAAAQRAEEA